MFILVFSAGEITLQLHIDTKANKFKSSLSYPTDQIKIDFLVSKILLLILCYAPRNLREYKFNFKSQQIQDDFKSR